MIAPIALQFYSIREDLTKDFESGIRRIADMGYIGVETAGFPNSTPEKAAKLFQSLGLTVCSAHTPLLCEENQTETLAIMKTLGSKNIVSGLGPGDFETMDLIKRSCDRFNEANALALQNGLTFSIHNHWWECQRIEDKYVYQIMLEQLAPEILFEVDTYWVRTAGLNPIDLIREYGSRAPLLHIKDGPCTKEDPMTAVGEGIMDFHSIVKEGSKTTEWMIVELDSCATDMMEAVQKSYNYLTQEGLSRGKV